MKYCRIPKYCGVYYVPPTTVVPSWLPQVSLSTQSKLYDTSSRTILTQTFVNPSKKDRIKKAKYNFPLYESCAVVAFRCFVAGRLIEGIVKEKNEAKVDYDAAVARGETAGLLEQFTPDVFRTSLGNIPPGATAKVEVEYIMELKHDAEVDGLRFTIPTSIAPRYGEAPAGLDTHFDGQPIQGAVEGGMKISIQITMPSNIQSVQSPSHPISVHLGGHVENVSDDAFNAKHAIATLGQTSTELGADFVLLVKCAELSSPRALLETHSTKSDSKAMMVTLVPKFTLPMGPKPEIVFVVDRSGSMLSRMEPLKSALSVFLKSLPVGVKFNICSFGSTYSFLWKSSQPYSAATLKKAQKHVKSMAADLGGTEIFQSIEATVSRRYKDLPLDIMVLTDGEVWSTEHLYEFIAKQTATGEIRVFTLGIGRDVSHSLVEGMARVGRGFAQILWDEKEGLEGKVVRMLRGGLSAHIKDYRLEWEGRPTEEQAKSPTTEKPTEVQSKSDGKRRSVYLQQVMDGVKKISLFDKQANTDAPISSEESKPDRFADLPEFVVPTVLQAPYKLPPLFPYSRTTVYVIITGNEPAPSSVWLRGTTISGDELELEIPVQVLPESGHTIHQLTGRKILQELEEGTSYLHSGKYGVNKEKNPGTFLDWVEREGIRVGLKYGLASKWTSFVAVEKRKKEKKVVKMEDKNVDVKLREKNADDELTEAGSVTEVGDFDDFDLEAQVCNISHGGGPADLDIKPAALIGGSGIMTRSKSARKKSLGFRVPLPKLSLPSNIPAPSIPLMSRMKFAKSSGVKTNFNGAVVPAPAFHGHSGFHDLNEVVKEKRMPSGSASATPELNVKECAKALIALQSFEGSFSLNTMFASILGRSLADLEAKLAEFTPADGAKLAGNVMKSLWATLLAISMFESKLVSEKDMWELVVEKAKDWISGLTLVQKKDVENLELMSCQLVNT